MSTSVKTELRSFIVENFLFGDESQAPGDAASLIESDIVDSTGILEIVGFLEERFGVVVADADIVPDNFDSLERLSAFVEARLVAGAARAAG